MVPEPLFAIKSFHLRLRRNDDSLSPWVTLQGQIARGLPIQAWDRGLLYELLQINLRIFFNSMDRHDNKKQNHVLNFSVL